MPLMISKMHMNASPPRERGRRGPRSGEEEFVLYLQGIPPHCRWQELKDFVRQTALHIRQAVVYDDQHGYPTGMGQIIVKNEDEAWRTYRKLSATGWDGHPLTVTLARANSPTRPIAGPTKSSSPGGHTMRYGGKLARHSVAGTPTPESPVTMESRSHSIASGTVYPQYVPPCTPTGHSHGHIQGFSPMADSSGGYGHHHHHHQNAQAGWNMHPDGIGILAFSPPGMTLLPPPVEQQQIEYPYYFPYLHPMQIPVRGQPVYAETRYHDYQQQQAPPAFFSQYPPAANQYYQHQQQAYQFYGYESRKYSFHSNSTSDIYTNPAATTTYNNEGGILQHQALPQGIRHIIIDNICPGVDVQTLQDHFRDAGHMLNCRIIRYNNHDNGNETRYNELSYPGQCYATATFSSPEEAERAVGMYNGSDLGGSRVVVRLDTEWDPSTAIIEEGNGNADGGGGESGWSRSQSYSVSFTASSNALLASSVSSSTATSLGTFSAYSESANSQLASIPPTNKIYHRPQHHQQHRERRDSGKEIFKHNTHPFLPSQSVQSDCVDDTSSRSVSPTSDAREAGNSTEEEKSRTTTIVQQPLVVNGSGPVGRAKM